MELIIALDTKDIGRARGWVKELGPQGVKFKIGLEAFVALGPSWVREVAALDYPIFLDLKLHDIPNTVIRAAEAAADLGIEDLTIHAAAGRKTFEGLRELKAKRNFAHLRILAVTVLTSFDEKSWQEVQGVPKGGSLKVIPGAVSHLAARALEWGADGIVCSPHEVKAIVAAHPTAWTAIPGIRLPGDASQDQSRTMTPLEAMKAGAKAIVLGRTVLGHPDPTARLNDVHQNLRGPS